VEFEECQGMLNYASVQDFLKEAGEEIARYEAKGFARQRADGTVKKRIVVDMLRSGGNSRITLLRVPDVLGSVRKMDEWEPPFPADPQCTTEFVLVDLADAFCHFAVTRDELQHCRSIGDGQIERTPAEQAKLLSMTLYSMQALGIMVSLEKGGRHITVELPFKICKEVYDALVSWLGKGMARIMWLKEKPAERGIISDASPMGIGAVLWRKDKETGRSLRRSRLSHGEAASQAVREAYASLRAVLAEAHSAQGLAMILKSDSSVALGIAQKLSSPSPSLNYIAAELALLLDTIDAKQIELYH
ncbi:Uncharacterized protein SCF082_LOCUS8895, partial [Durusdinium trenchii]